MGHGLKVIVTSSQFGVFGVSYISIPTLFPPESYEFRAIQGTIFPES